LLNTNANCEQPNVATHKRQPSNRRKESALDSDHDHLRSNVADPVVGEQAALRALALAFRMLIKEKSQDFCKVRGDDICRN